MEEATAPFLYALTTKSGGECVAHAVQSLTDLDCRATVLSIDGISAYDLISSSCDVGRIATSSWERYCASFRAPVLLQALPVSLDRRQRRHPCDPAWRKGASKAMPSCPLSLQGFLLPDEHLFAFLDDIYVVCLPDHASPRGIGAVRPHLKFIWRRLQVWTRGSQFPLACVEMQEARGSARIWRGVGPPAQQGGP